MLNRFTGAINRLRAGIVVPVINGTAALGISNRFSRSDHVHPTDTSRLAAASNLSDVGSASTSRTNLGLGTAATVNYASGSFTPTMAYATPGNSSFAYGTAIGEYVKIGDLVYVNIVMVVTPTIGTGSGSVIIGTLPFAAVSGTNCVGVLSGLDADWASWPGAAVGSLAVAFNTSTTLLLQNNRPAAAAANFAAANMTTGAAHVLSLSVVYKAVP